MPTPTTITIAGVAVSIPGTIVLGSLVAVNRDGYPTLSFYTRGGTLPPLPNPYINKEARLTINGTLRFVGTVMSAHVEYNAGLGWVVAYSAHGLAARTERFPHTDANTGTDTSVYNASPEDTGNYLPSRAGRTVGQIVADVLSFKTNGDNLTARGVGNLTYDAGSGTYLLPTATAADLAALTLIPQGPIYFAGERFWHALQGILAEWAPRCMLHVEPGGDIRVLNLASFTPHTFTMGTDPILPSELSRDIGECFSRVVVRGAPIAVMALLKLSEGTLVEDFAYGSYTNAQAKTAWNVGQFHQPSTQDTGTCTCPDTLHVVVTSSNSSYSWGADYWDQTSAGRHGTINLIYTAAVGVDLAWTARIVANTALAPPGTPSSTLTIDAPLPHLNFNKYTITGYASQDGSIVWRKYKIVSTAIWPKITNESTFPFPFFNSGGGVTDTSTPMGAVLWPISGTGPPYNSFSLPFQYDGNGRVYFAGPTYVVANNAAPADVWVLIPYNASVNQAVAPADVAGVPQYDGTVYTVDGVSETLYVPVNNWRDPANQVNMQAYAAEILECVKQTHIDGSVTYLGLYEPALAPGMKVNVAGNGYSTQWESVNLNVVQVELTWNPAGPTSWVTTMRATNRMNPLSAAAFMRPSRGFQPIGAESDPFGGMAGMLGGLPTYHTPGEFGVQEGGAIPTSMADLGIDVPQFQGPAGLPSRPESTPTERRERRERAEAEHAADVAMRNEQREALPAGGFVGPGRAVPADVAERAQAAHDDRLQAGRDRAAVMRRQREERAGQQRGEIAQRNQERAENPEAGREAAQAAQVQREERGRQERAAAENRRAAREAQEQQQRQEIARRNEAKDKDEGTA